MSKKANTDFISLVNNEDFVRLVQNSENYGELIHKLFELYPEKQQSVKYAVEFIVSNSKDNRKLESRDFSRILNTILSHAKSSKSTRTRKIILDVLWKAAVVILLISAGGKVLYNHLSKDPLEQFAANEKEGDDKGVIILSDGTKQILQDNDSYIEYNNQEDAIIVSNQNKQQEKIKKPDNNNVLNQIIVPYGQTQTVALSDGTIVKLNAGSRLTFPNNFQGRTREVYLKGEGFFDVTENKDKPFRVLTEHLNVEVLGTQFNVTAYNDEDKVSTVLVEGKVKVSQKNKVFNNDEFIISPGQGCFYTVQTEKSIVQEIDVNNYISWKDGWFTFKDMTLLEIINRLKRYYNKNIEIEDELLANTVVSGKLMLSNDFIEVIHSLAITIEGNYRKIDEENYLIKY